MISPWDWGKVRVATFHTPIWHYAGEPSQMKKVSEIRQEKKAHNNWKEKHTTIFIPRQNSCVYKTCFRTQQQNM